MRGAPVIALALAALVAQGGGTVTYEGVPAAVGEVLVYEWREGSAPVPVVVDVRRTGDEVVLTGTASAAVVVIFRREDGAYLLDGPMPWPAGPVRRQAEVRWRRTDRGPVPERVPAGAPVQWLRADSLEGTWPRCFRDDGRWECWGVQPENRGVVIVAADRLWWATGSPAVVTPLKPSTWGRLVLVATGQDAALDGLRFTFAHPVAPPSERLGSLRLQSSPVPDTRFVRLSPEAVWVSGDKVPPKAWMEVRSNTGGPVFLSLEEVSEAPAMLPLYVRLAESRSVTGLVTGTDGSRAAGALVTAFRAIDPPAAPGSRMKPRQVFAAETLAKEDGTFEIEGLGEADYELVAFHSRLGKGTLRLNQGQTQAEVRLASNGFIRGRVVSGGRPLSGVDVVSVPDPSTYNAAQDLTDAKGGDAKTGPDGRFVVAVAAAGGGELRIGGGVRAVTRVPLPRGPAASLDLGDIELGSPMEVIAVLDRDPGCVLQAIGPIGRMGLQMVNGVRAADGTYRVALPEAGAWQFGLQCGEKRRGLSPASVQIGPTNAGKELRFMVR